MFQNSNKQSVFIFKTRHKPNRPSVSEPNEQRQSHTRSAYVKSAVLLYMCFCQAFQYGSKTKTTRGIFLGEKNNPHTKHPLFLKVKPRQGWQVSDGAEAEDEQVRERGAESRGSRAARDPQNTGQPQERSGAGAAGRHEPGRGQGTGWCQGSREPAGSQGPAAVPVTHRSITGNGVSLSSPPNSTDGLPFHA